MAYYMNNIIAAVCLKIKLPWNLSVQLYISDDVPKTENKDEHVTHDVLYTTYTKDDTCMSTFTFSVSTRCSLHYYTSPCVDVICHLLMRPAN